MADWNLTTEPPNIKRRRKTRVVVINPGVQMGYYDAKTELVSNTEISRSLTDFEWWIKVPLFTLAIETD